MLIALVPVIFIILGFILFFTVPSPKWQEVGKLMLFSGFLSLAFALAKNTIHLGGGG